MSVAGTGLTADLSRAVSLAIDVTFSSTGPRHFGAPHPSATPLVAPGFPGLVSRGASCNCQTITLTPHCNGTHTECVGHLTSEVLDAHRVIPTVLLPCLVISITPVDAADTDESTDPAPQRGDLLITRRSLESAWPQTLPFSPTALAIRTLPGTTNEQRRDDATFVPPYLSRQAAQLLVDRGIEHLVIDQPSIDRSHDEGKLTAHRVFFGLPPGSHVLAQATRAGCTVTELACIPDGVADGGYLLALQAPAIAGDAVPSRPLIYPLVSE